MAKRVIIILTLILTAQFRSEANGLPCSVKCPTVRRALGQNCCRDMASKNVDVDQIVKEALSTVAEMYPDNFKKLSSSQSTGSLSEAAKETANEVITFLNREGEKSIDDFPKNVGKEKMIKSTTFEMAVKNVEGKKLAVTSRDGKEFRPPIDLSTKAGVLKAYSVQKACIVVDSVIFVLQLIGIKVPDDQKSVKKAIEVAEKALSKSTVLNSKIDAMVTAFKSDFMAGVATAMADLVINLCETANVFFDIASKLLSKMNWWDWGFASVKIAASIATLVATGGASVVKVVLQIATSDFFLNKLVNISTFADMKTVM